MNKFIIVFVSCFLIQLTNKIQAQTKDSLQLKETKPLTKRQMLQIDKLFSSNVNILTELKYSYNKNEIKNYYLESIPNVTLSVLPYYINSKKAGELIVQLSDNKNYKSMVVWKEDPETLTQATNAAAQKSLFCSWSGWFNVGSPYCTLVLICPVIKKGTIQEQQNNCVKNRQIKNVMKRYLLKGCYCL